MLESVWPVAFVTVSSSVWVIPTILVGKASGLGDRAVPVPVPCRFIDDGLKASELETLRVPVRAPTAVGLNRIRNEQELLAFTVCPLPAVPQSLLEILKSPVTLGVTPVSATEPMLVNTTGSGALVDATDCGPNTSGLGERVTCDPPVPDRLTTMVVPRKLLSVMVRVPTAGPL